MPWTVTGVPPASGPLFGSTEVTVPAGSWTLAVAICSAGCVQGKVPINAPLMTTVKLLGAAEVDTETDDAPLFAVN